jgi:hypothetical protein
MTFSENGEIKIPSNIRDNNTNPDIVKVTYEGKNLKLPGGNILNEGLMDYKNGQFYAVGKLPEAPRGTVVNGVGITKAPTNEDMPLFFGTATDKDGIYFIGETQIIIKQRGREYGSSWQNSGGPLSRMDTKSAEEYADKNMPKITFYEGNPYFNLNADESFCVYPLENFNLDLTTKTNSKTGENYYSAEALGSGIVNVGANPLCVVESDYIFLLSPPEGWFKYFIEDFNNTFNQNVARVEQITRAPPNMFVLSTTRSSGRVVTVIVDKSGNIRSRNIKSDDSDNGLDPNSPFNPMNPLSPMHRPINSASPYKGMMH